MTLIIRQILKFIELLHSENSQNQLAWGFVLGMFMGFTPLLTLHWFLYLVLLLLFRINMGAAFLGFGVFKILAFAFDPLFDKLGLFTLTEVGSLKPFWAALYHLPVFPYTYFYNTIVMGSFLSALVLALPLFLLSRQLIIKYRVIVVERIRHTFLWKAWKASKLYSLYAKYQQFTQ